MDRSRYADPDYRQPHMPPASPPVIDSNADPADAATLAMDNGDSDAPGSRPARFNRRREDAVAYDHGGEGHLLSGGAGRERIAPGQQPDEIVPDRGGDDVPDPSPDEVAPGQGDFDRPDSSPVENPPPPDAAPAETPPPPD